MMEPKCGGPGRLTMLDGVIQPGWGDLARGRRGLPGLLGIRLVLQICLSAHATRIEVRGLPEPVEALVSPISDSGAPAGGLGLD